MKKKIANGSVGVVVGFEYPLHWKKDYIGRSMDGLFVPSCEPDTILVLILGQEGRQFHPSVPPGVFRSKRRSKTVTVTYPNRRFSFTISGFPLRLAFAATTFKVQGLSLKDYTIADWKELGQKHRRGEAYVALSRGEVRHALRITHLFNEQLKSWFKPSIELLQELDRLKLLHDTTMTKLQRGEDK